MQKLIFLELNEINFDLVKKYCLKYNLKNLNHICLDILFTSSENKYEMLEPWIQWLSVHTGLNADQHKVFRLGDAIHFNNRQYFEDVEDKGYDVGVISSMNAVNNLKNPSYFIPDPWTHTKTDGSFISNILNKLLKSVVNNNANNKVGIKNYLYLFFLLTIFARFKNYFLYIKYFFTSFKKKWRKALFLDLFLNDIHIKMFRKKKPNFSTLFLNAGAHIQHHYLFNSIANDGSISNPEHIIKKNIDPFKEALFLYEKILDDYLDNKDFNIIIATGLTQILTKDIQYYYRLKNHADFLKRINISFEKVYPRMSRDFLLEFKNDNDRDNCFKKLDDIIFNKSKIFGTIDIRSKSLFVTLTYNKEIKKDDEILIENYKFNLYDLVSFVSIKNGMHFERGFLFLDKYLKNINKIHSYKISLIELNTIVKNFFPLKQKIN